MPIPCPISPSMRDTRCLRTPSAAISTHSLLSHISDHFVESVSWAEKFTLMEVLISTFSVTLDENSNPDEPTYLMWEVITQTYHSLREIQGLVLIMQSRMETWSQEGLSDRAETQLVELRINGLKSSMLQMNRRFGNVLHNWIQRHFAHNSPAYRNMWDGSTLPSMRNIEARPGSNLEAELFLSWMHGERPNSRYVSLQIKGFDPLPSGGRCSRTLPNSPQYHIIIYPPRRRGICNC